MTPFGKKKQKKKKKENTSGRVVENPVARGKETGPSTSRPPRNTSGKRRRACRRSNGRFFCQRPVSVTQIQWYSTKKWRTKGRQFLEEETRETSGMFLGKICGSEGNSRTDVVFVRFRRKVETAIENEDNRKRN